MATLISALSKDFVISEMIEKGATNDEIEKVSICYNALSNVSMLEKFFGIEDILNKYILGVK